MSRSSLRSQALFPPAMRILSQSSKDGLAPEDYVLIAGDSYAMGVGDWLNSIDKDNNPPYHSAHVIHELSGRDVISAGESGAGSITAMVITPVRRYLAMKRFRVGMPDTVLVYFYEGNDLTDNMGYLRRHYYDTYDNERIYDKNYFQKFLESELTGKIAVKQYTDRLYLMGYIVNLYKAFKEYLAQGDRTGDDREEEASLPVSAGSLNDVFIENRPVRVPDYLQSPALELNRKDLDLSLYVMEQSLAFLVDYFNGAHVHVVYLPSPLSSYKIASSRVTAQVYETERTLYPAERVEEYHSYISGRVKAIAAGHGAGFLDLTDTVRDAGKSGFIHGPNDWKHFNEKGYRIVGKAVSDYLDKVK